MHSVLVTPPAYEPVTLEEAKAQCRVRHTEEDDLIEFAIQAARGYAEDYTRRSIVQQTRRAYIDKFPRYGGIVLPWPPVISVASITYLTTAGVETVLTDADFLLDLNPAEPTLWPLYDETWPDSREYRGAIAVLYDAGYTSAALIPQAIRHAILMLTEHFYVNRGAVNVGNIVTEMKLGAHALLDPWRVRRAA